MIYQKLTDEQKALRKARIWVFARATQIQERGGSRQWAIGQAWKEYRQRFPDPAPSSPWRISRKGPPRFESAAAKRTRLRRMSDPVYAAAYSISQSRGIPLDDALVIARHELTVDKKSSSVGVMPAAREG